ncbi:hypothetical protein CU084_08330 [Bacillus velezensis]|nr:hypothetical protein CU084_08330 [Bacillus velezensis]
MLFHNLADTNSAAYFEQMTFDVNGDLNVDVFIRSLESLMQRHTILRTNIYQGWKDTPLQIVYKHKSSEWCLKIYVDLMPENRKISRLLRRIK